MLNNISNNSNLKKNINNNFSNNNQTLEVPHHIPSNNNFINKNNPNEQITSKKKEILINHPVNQFILTKKKELLKEVPNLNKPNRVNFLIKYF